MQTWKPQTRANATWGEQFLRELSRLLYAIPFIGWIVAIVSFFMFASSKEHRAIHDQIGGTVVLHDPSKVLQPTAPMVGTARAETAGVRAVMAPRLGPAVRLARPRDRDTMSSLSIRRG